MERVHEAATVTASTCVACEAPVSAARCEHCGAATRAGPYRVLRVLSRSQHGAMYLAEDDAGAKVALKELVFSLVPTTQELDAFAREARLLEALRHPHIPKFLGSFTVGHGVSTRLYLAQQFLPGQSLLERLRSEHFDEASVLVLARQALDVLAYLHERSPVVVHRDVKPDNLMVGLDGRLSLVDFGAARAVKAAGTHRATLVGTFGYMAPEQLGGTVDARSDLYGLGATLVHLLTRIPPERLLSPGMSLDFQKHVNVSVKTERFLARLVATRPDERFASARDALAFLDGGVASRPRSARTLAFGAVGLALIAATSVALLASRKLEPPRQVTEPMAQAALPVRPTPTDPGQPPPAGEPTFPWVLGHWTFGKPGHWVLDESGRGHHALLPSSGFTNSFFGLEWDGTVGLTLDDSPDFAPTGSFTVSADLQLTKGALTGPATLLSRGDPNGTFAWALQMLPLHGSRVVRFSIANEAGEVSTIDGVLQDPTRLSSLYATFDPKTGEQRLSMDCVTLAKAVTVVRPAQRLPAGAKLQLITGVRGVVQDLKLSRGLMRASGAPGKCGYTGEDLNGE